jgi:hypothetical protein
LTAELQPHDPSTGIDHNSRSEAPVFSIGCSRSGTTLLYHMILSAGDFAVYRMESHVFTLLEPRFQPLTSNKNKQRMLNAWYQSRLFTRSGVDRELFESRVMAECRNGGDFLRILMEEICRSQGVRRWAETTPEHILYMARIKETIPKALFIHVIRDGRDVALSWEKLSQIRPLPGDPHRPAIAAAIYWDWFVSRGRKVGHALGEDYTEVSYEDLVIKPVEILKGLEPFIAHPLDYDRIRSVAIGSVAAPNSAYKGEKRSPIGRWKTDFTPHELEVCEALIGRSLIDLGYETVTPAATKKMPAYLAALRATYRNYFEAKLFVKTRTPLGRWFTSRNLARL